MRIRIALLAVLISCSASAQRIDQSPDADEFAKLPWQEGPGTASIAGKATLTLTDKDAFLGEEGTRRLLVLMQNPPRNGHYAILPLANENWVGVFAFDASGYVKDDEEIDADSLLKAMKEQNVYTNTERKKLGLPALHLVGWHVPPHYDAQTNRLEWGTRLRTDDNQIVVNYTARLLGRTGVMSAILISDPDTLEADRQSFRRRLERFHFNPGERYSEFRQGDNVAAYGLAALVAGGAAAVATKKGLWAVIGGFIAASWKLLVGIVVALLAGLRALFRPKKP